MIGLYLAGLIALSLYLSKQQHSRADYYVGGRAIGPWPIAISAMATQCTSNSILGVSAFVAFASGGAWAQSLACWRVFYLIFAGGNSYRMFRGCGGMFLVLLLRFSHIL